MKNLAGGLCLAGIGIILAIGCGDGASVAAKLNAPPSAPPQYRATATVAALPPPKMRQLEFAENDFTESDKSRDPFRSFAVGFAEQAKKTTKSQVTVLLSEYSLDELKLVAIVSGGDYPRAMLTDPQGKGWVLRKGDFVGKPDIVHTGGSGGTDYQLNWRVDRVRAEDIVFIREDPAQPGIAPATRIITLHPEGDKPTGKQG
jgi:type IV pilus assembly protein PilP